MPSSLGTETCDNPPKSHCPGPHGTSDHLCCLEHGHPSSTRGEEAVLGAHATQQGLRSHVPFARQISGDRCISTWSI